jgi:hypothetical protein
MGRPFSVIVLRGEKNKPRSTADLQKAVFRFRQYEKNEQRRGWKIEWTDWSSRIVGKQKWVFRVIVETEEDFLYLLQKEKESTGFKDQLQVLLKWQPGIRNFFSSEIERIPKP